MLLLQTPSESMRIQKTKSQELREALSQLLQPTAEPNPLRRWYRRATNFLEEKWRRCWVILLWLSICAGLFGWKFVQYRHRAVFKVMGYCVCVAKGGAETLKFNMAVVLLPVCRNTITWIRSRTPAGGFVPFDDSLGFHKVVAAGIVVGVGLHVVSHLTCDFPRLLHATDDEYETMKPFFGDVKPPNYWWFVKGTEGWTGLVMVVLMAIAFTLAISWFRRGKLRLSRPKPLPASVNTSCNRLIRFVYTSRNRLNGFVDAMLNRFTGFNAFWYTHHLFVAVYALLLVHGHFLYLTNKWQKKTVCAHQTMHALLHSGFCK
jgi:respiratory burst oxidase